MSTTVTPYCSVCHSAGKSKAEYTSHYLRASKAPNAKTTCPYLLAITCGYCKGPGHTPKYCPVAMEKNKAQAQQVQAQAQQQVQVQAQAQQQTQVKAQAKQQTKAQAKQQTKAQAPVQTRKNGFAILESLMEEEEATAERLEIEKIETAQKVIAHQQAFPTIGKAKTVAQAPGVSWAALAAKPKTQAPKAQAPQAQAQSPKAQTQAQQTQAQQTQAQAQAPKAQTQVVDAPYDDENPEMLKHCRKTVAVLFQEKAKEQEESENTHSGCGFSWADAEY